MASSIASAAELFVTKCIDATNEVIKLTQKKIQEPGSIVDFNVKGNLDSSILSDMGSLRKLGQQYIERNSTALAVQGLEAVGLDDEVKQGVDFFMNIISSAVASYNNLLLSFTKQTARSVMKELDTKREVREELIDLLNTYVNTLEQMRAGPSVFDEYLEQLRDALVLVNKAKIDLTTVTSTLKATDRFLERKFNDVKENFTEAKNLVQPTDNPYFDPAFLKNQVLVEKTTTSNNKEEVIHSEVGKVDSGSPTLLEGSFNLAEVGDFVKVIYSDSGKEVNPINNGEYSIESILSPSKVQLSKRLSEVNLLNGVVDKNILYGNSVFSDPKVNLNVVQVGDDFSWGTTLSEKAVIQSINFANKSPISCVLDQQIDPVFFSTNGEMETSYKITRGNETIIETRTGIIKLGEVIEEFDPSDPVYISNQLSGITGITENVEYTISRKDGFRFDQQTLYDSEADFTDRNIVGHLLKVISPSEIAGAYKISSSSKNEIKIVNPLETDLIVPIFDIEYEIKADLGIPTDKDQFANIMAIPAMTNKIILSSKGYFRSTLLANTYLASFGVALDQLLNSMPNVIKKHVVQLLDKALDDTDNLEGNMATILNGAPGRISGPASNFNPNPLSVSSYAFKWSMDMSLIKGVLNIVPAESLAKFNLAAAPLAAYRSAVEQISRIDDYRSGTALVIGEDGAEDVGQLETQLFTLMAEGNTLIFTGSLREEIISLGKSIIRNLELAQTRDDDVYDILDTWNKFPLPLEDELSEMLGGLNDILRSLQLDKMGALFQEGKFTDLLGIDSGKAATYTGAALIGLALLKECFDTPEDSDSLDKIVDELEKEEQLIEVSFSINFDLAILEKYAECLRIGNLAKDLNLKEIICGFIEESSVGKSLDSMFNATDSGTTGTQEKAAGTLIGL